MRTFAVIALTLAALTAVRADDRPTPLVDRRAPDVVLSGSEGWQLSGVAGYDLENGKIVLIVEGDVINAGKAERKTPEIRLAVRDQTKRELHTWTVRTDAPRIRPGDWSAFKGRLENPPEAAYSVEIRAVDQE